MEKVFCLAHCSIPKAGFYLNRAVVDGETFPTDSTNKASQFITFHIILGLPAQFSQRKCSVLPRRAHLLFLDTSRNV